MNIYARPGVSGITCDAHCSECEQDHQVRLRMSDLDKWWKHLDQKVPTEEDTKTSWKENAKHRLPALFKKRHVEVGKNLFASIAKKRDDSCSYSPPYWMLIHKGDIKGVYNHNEAGYQHATFESRHVDKFSQSGGDRSEPDTWLRAMGRGGDIVTEPSRVSFDANHVKPFDRWLKRKGYTQTRTSTFNEGPPGQARGAT